MQNSQRQSAKKINHKNKSREQHAFVNTANRKRDKKSIIKGKSVTKGTARRLLLLLLLLLL